MRILPFCRLATFIDQARIDRFETFIQGFAGSAKFATDGECLLLDIAA